MTIHTELQKGALPSMVELYELDLTPLGEGILYFTPHTQGGTANVAFGGQVYLPMPIRVTGLSQSTGGAPPRPTLVVSNVTRFIQPFITENQDLVGMVLTRKLTLDKFLDGGSSPDDTQVISVTKLVIQQKVRMNKVEVEFMLSSPLDQPNLKLPQGIVLRTQFPAAGLFRRQ